MARGNFPSAKQDQFVLRLPDGMRDRIKAAAEANNRSMNAEIVATLEEKYPAPQSIDEFLRDINARIDSFPKDLNELHPEAFLKAQLIEIRDTLLAKMGRK